MKDLINKSGSRMILGLVCLLAGSQAWSATTSAQTFWAGLGYDYLPRTVVWKGDESSSEIISHLVSARADIRFPSRWILSLSAGLSLTDFKDLTFAALPISLEYGGAPLKGISLAAGLTAPLVKTGDVEISAAGQVILSVGMSKTWPLEGFAVEGEARGKMNWLEASLGPRVSYLVSGRFVPYLEVSARWLTADFEMSETLGDLSGSETKKVPGDVSFSVAIGADANVSSRFAIKAKAGIIPFTGGVDGLATVGLLYRF